MEVQMDLMLLGLNVKTHRKNLNYTQFELAEKTNLSTVHISHIENGKVKMSIDTFICMCNVLKVTPNDILAGQYEADEECNDNYESDNFNESGDYSISSRLKENIDKMSMREKRVMLELSELLTMKRRNDV